MYNPIKNYQYVHGTYVPQDTNSGTDALVASVKDPRTGDTRLHIVRNPACQFWITKPALRNHKHKKECVPLSEVDMHVCQYKYLSESIEKALGDRKSYSKNRWVMRSPYVYGADIDPLIVMKLEYKEACKDSVDYFKVGAIDIEVSVLGDNQIILLSYADFHTRTVYCAVLNTWAETTLEELELKAKEELARFREGLNDDALRIWDEQPFKVVFELFEEERDLLIWSFRNIHKCAPDFCGVWNIAYDIPYIMDRAVFRRISPEQLFCHPDVPNDLKFLEFKEDKSAVHAGHITDRWHQVECPGYTRWYDPMCLYSRLRVTEAKLPFYTLDFVGNKIIGTGKMQFGVNDTHHSMQANDKVGYCVYNTLDAIIPVLSNAVTDDVVSMTMLADTSLLTHFASQTVKLKAFFYEYCMKHGLVTGTAFGSQVQDTDVYLGNVGGAVLNPLLMRVTGATCIKEVDISTNLYKLCCDIDFASQYPSTTIAFNISKETKMATFLWIGNSPYNLDQVLETKDVKDAKNKLNPRARANSEHMFNFLCQHMGTKENSVLLAKAFNLPGYGEMLKLWDNRTS